MLGRKERPYQKYPNDLLSALKREFAYETSEYVVKDGVKGSKILPKRV